MSLQAVSIVIEGAYTQLAIISEDGDIQQVETLPKADCEYPPVHRDRLVETIGRLAHDNKITGIGLAPPEFFPISSMAKGFNPDRPKNLTAVVQLNL